MREILRITQESLRIEKFARNRKFLSTFAGLYSRSRRKSKVLIVCIVIGRVSKVPPFRSVQAIQFHQINSHLANQNESLEK